MKDVDVLQDLWTRKGVFEKLECRYLNDVCSKYEWEGFKNIRNPKFIGLMSSMTPSGESYNPACFNLSAKEILKNDIYTEVLGEVTKQHEMYLIINRCSEVFIVPEYTQLNICSTNCEECVDRFECVVV